MTSYKLVQIKKGISNYSITIDGVTVGTVSKNIQTNLWEVSSNQGKTEIAKNTRTKAVEEFLSTNKKEVEVDFNGDLLSNEEIDELVSIRNYERHVNSNPTIEIVKFMTKEQMRKYRNNCLFAIDKRKKVAQFSNSETMRQIALEVIEKLESYIAYIDENTKEEIEVVEESGMAIIDTFLNEWEVKATKYYENLREEYLKIINLTDEDIEITDYNLQYATDTFGRHKFNKEQRTELIEKVENGTIEKFKLSRVLRDIRHGMLKVWTRDHSKNEVNIVSNMRQEGYLQRILEVEKDNKKVRLIQTIEKKTGAITDAKSLRIAQTGEINGIIVGEKASASIQTISAGGYNIQCFHYRLLVKVIK